MSSKGRGINNSSNECIKKIKFLVLIHFILLSRPPLPFSSVGFPSLLGESKNRFNGPGIFDLTALDELELIRHARGVKESDIYNRFYIRENTSHIIAHWSLAGRRRVNAPYNHNRLLRYKGQCRFKRAVPNIPA